MVNLAKLQKRNARMFNIIRNAIVFRIVRLISIPLSKYCFRYSYQKIPKIKGPVLLLGNHNTDLDPLLLGIAAKRSVAFVATENVVRMGFLGRLILRYCNPILQIKGMQGTATVRSILSRTKNGESVAFFPEGNRSFNGITCPIPPATGKLAKACGATLVTYRFVGGYFSQPRWGKGLRKGKVTGQVGGVYTPDMLASMTNEEVNEVIARDLYVDAYEQQKIKPVAFIGKRPAECLESMLFMCPECGGIGTLKSEGDTVSCACGYTAKYTEYGYIEDTSGTAKTITELDSWQRSKLTELVDTGSEDRLFADEIEFTVIGKDHKPVSDNVVTLAAYRDRLTAGDTEMRFDEIDGFAVNQRNLLLIHLAGSDLHYELSGDFAFNALKYLYLFRTCKKSINGML